MRYPIKFIRDFDFYMSSRHIFNFDGSTTYLNSKGKQIIQYDPDGIDGKLAFYLWDSTGEINPTKHPNLLKSLLKTKGSINFHIKMYTEGRLDGTLSYNDLVLIGDEYKFPQWVIKAVESQKNKEYIKSGIPKEYIDLNLIKI